MSAEPSDLYEVLKKIRYDTTAIQARVTDAFAILAELNLPDQSRAACPTCGLSLKGPRTLAEHVYHSHDGPTPAHWASIERLIAPEADNEEPDLALPDEAAR